MVTHIVAEFMRNKEHMDSFADAFMASYRSDGVEAAKRRKQAAAALLRAQNALNRVLDQYEEGVIEKPAMLERSARWKAEAASAQARLIEIQSAPDTDYHQAAARAYADAIKNLAKMLNKGKAVSARDELRKLIDSVTLFPKAPYKPYNIDVRGPIVALSLVAGARFNQNCSSKNKRERKLITLNSWYFRTDFRIIPASLAA